MKYKVALRRSDEGYSVSVPGLPGCWSQGATEAEALENIGDSIREHLAVVSEQLKEGDVRDAGLDPEAFKKLLKPPLTTSQVVPPAAASRGTSDERVSHREVQMSPLRGRGTTTVPASPKTESRTA